MIFCLAPPRLHRPPRKNLPWVSNLIIPPPYIEVSNKLSPTKVIPWDTCPTKSPHSAGGELNYSPMVKVKNFSYVVRNLGERSEPKHFGGQRA